MTLNFYTLSVIYLVYSFLGWVAETVVATIRGGRFAPGASSGGGRGVFAAAETGKGPGHKKFALSCKENPVFS